jgi:hypothetical protein
LKCIMRWSYLIHIIASVISSVKKIPESRMIRWATEGYHFHYKNDDFSCQYPLGFISISASYTKDNLLIINLSL